jgi:hypothetical protein
MGLVRAFAVVAMVAVAASPLVGGWMSWGVDASTAFAESDQLTVRGRHDEKDDDKKNKNRETQDDEDSHSNAPKFGNDRKKDQQNENDRADLPRDDTNAYAKDNYELEGNVVGLNCDASPKQIMITTLDGQATLYEGPKDGNGRADRLHCGELMTGDYVFVHDAQKRNEQEYDAYYISCQQQKQESPDNSNDNEGDTDPNCLHIWYRS